MTIVKLEKILFIKNQFLAAQVIQICQRDPLL